MSKYLWTRYALIFLGAWLIIMPLTFSYDSEAMKWNDITSGLLLLFFGSMSITGRHNWAPWGAVLLGIWLQLAPLAFWAPHGLMYLNDTAVGILVILFAILIPGAPGDRVEEGPTVPPGWSYNPSSWSQRLPIILLAATCWLIARYMAAYQLGYRDTVWDPVFDNGTLDVITSSISKDFPVSDAGLGACAYTIEALMGLKGGVRRWYTMPWSVILFGILVVPLGLISITLVVLQPVIVGHWCFWCLLTAVCMLFMISLTVDEVVATLQYLNSVRKKRLPFWTIFWNGGTITDETKERELPPLNSSIRKTFPEMIRGTTIPWNLLLCALGGLWLMASPSFYGMKSIGADVNYVIGALSVTVAIVSMAEVTRAGRYILVLFGLWIAASPWFLFGDPPDSMWSDLISGLLLAVLCLPLGKIKYKYGSWDRYIF